MLALPDEKTGSGALRRLAQGTAAAGMATVYWMAAAALCFIVANSLFFTSYFSKSYDEVIEYRFDIFPVWLLLCAVLAAGGAWLFKTGRWRAVGLPVLGKLLLCYTAAFGTVWVFMVRSAPVDDALTLFSTANSFIAGDYSALANNAYMGVYPFQLGAALYFELICRVAGANSVRIAQLLNVAWVTLAYQVLVRITKELSPNDERPVFCVTLLLFFCLPPLFYSTFLYGTLPGLCCGLLAVLFTLRHLAHRRAWLLAPVVAFSALGCLFKNNTLIFAVGIAAVLVLDILKNKGAKRLVAVAVLLVASLFVLAPVKGLYRARSGQPLDAGMPRVLWAAMGLRPSQRAPGWYSGVSLGLYEESGYSPKDAAKSGRDLIATSLGQFGDDPAYAADFFYHKEVSQWNEPSFASLWISHFDNPHTRPLGAIATSIYEGALNKPALQVMNGFHFVVFFFALFGLLAARKKMQPAQLLPFVIFLGGFLFHTIWEAKSQYTLPYFLLLIPPAGMGLCHAATLLEKHFSPKRPVNRHNF